METLRKFYLVFRPYLGAFRQAKAKFQLYSQKFHAMSAEDLKHFRVLSIQSHVVSGYVGNKSACFPLQVLGLEVDFINSVQLSNHTGYKHIKGQCLNAEDLHNLYEGLKLNSLTDYTHILTGYVGASSFLTKLGEIIQDLKKENPSICYVCDPVMGDNGKLYVPKELLPIYKDTIIPLADLITPNQFETELLTGLSIKTKTDVLEAIDIFHEKGVKTVILSSVEIDSSDKLQLFGSTLKGSEKSVISMDIPKLDAAFTGSGDLFSALLLAWMAKTDGDLRVSCEKTINTMQEVLKRTLNSASGNVSAAAMELKLIQSKKDIENPSDVLRCKTVL